MQIIYPGGRSMQRPPAAMEYSFPIPYSLSPIPYFILPNANSLFPISLFPKKYVPLQAIVLGKKNI